MQPLSLFSRKRDEHDMIVFDYSTIVIVAIVIAIVIATVIATVIVVVSSSIMS